MVLQLPKYILDLLKNRMYNFTSLTIIGKYIIFNGHIFYIIILYINLLKNFVINLVIYKSSFFKNPQLIFLFVNLF